MNKYTIDMNGDGYIVHPIPRSIMEFRFNDLQNRLLPRQWTNNSIRHRSAIVNWILNISVVFKLSNECLYTCISYIDIVIPILSAKNNNTLGSGELQLIALTSLLISGKINEIYSPEITDFVYVSDGVVNAMQMVEMEKELLSILGGNLFCASVINFIPYYNTSIDIDDGINSLSIALSKIYTHSVYYTPTNNEWMFLESGSSVYHSSSIACGIGYVASRLIGNTKEQSINNKVLQMSDANIHYMGIRVIMGIRDVLRTHNIKEFKIDICFEDLAYLENFTLLTESILSDNSSAVVLIPIKILPYMSNVVIDIREDWNNNKPKKIKTLGEGSFGKVVSASMMSNNDKEKLVAMKIIRNDADNGGAVHQSALREIACESLFDDDSCDHSSNARQLADVVKFHRVHIGKKKTTIIMDLQLSSLNKFIVPENEKKNVVRQLCESVYHLHTRGVIHRDLKTQNVLTNDLINIKLADFGISKSVTQPIKPMTHEVYTLHNRPPEILMNTPIYTFASDIWSLGCTIAEILTGKILFQGDCEIDQLYKIFKTLGTPNEYTWDGVNNLPGYKLTFPNWKANDVNIIFPNLDASTIQFILSMLQYDPLLRPDILEVLQHPYFHQ